MTLQEILKLMAEKYKVEKPIVTIYSDKSGYIENENGITLYRFDTIEELIQHLQEK